MQCNRGARRLSKGSDSTVRTPADPAVRDANKIIAVRQSRWSTALTCSAAAFFQFSARDAQIANGDGEEFASGRRLVADLAKQLVERDTAWMCGGKTRREACHERIPSSDLGFVVEQEGRLPRQLRIRVRVVAEHIISPGAPEVLEVVSPPPSAGTSRRRSRAHCSPYAGTSKGGCFHERR